MTPLVTAAVLFAAVTHASWNAIAHLAFGQGAQSFRAGVNARSRGAGQG
ncbi:hypothetical protein ACFWDQ_04380 [Streptomyces sp. NPDC060053]